MPVYVFDAPAWYQLAVGSFTLLLIVSGIWFAFRGEK